MNREQFLDALKIVVRDATISGMVRNLERPPGRRPSRALVESSEFYLSLPDGGKAQLATIVADAVDETIFALLSVLDGVRSVESEQPKGRLELKYVGAEDVILNPRVGPHLYDLYNARVKR